MKIDLIGIFLSSLLSLVIGIATTRYFAARRKVSWFAAERKVLDPVGGRFPEGVDILFDGKKVERLSEWKIGIWNSGNQTVRDLDFIDQFGLYIIFPHREVLKISPVVQSRPAVGAQVSLTAEDRVALRVSLLDTGDGIVFTAYTAESASRESSAEALPQIQLEGSIAGIPNGAVKAAPAGRRTPALKLYATAGMLYLFLSLTGFAALLAVAIEANPTEAFTITQIIGRLFDARGVSSSIAVLFYSVACLVFFFAALAMAFLGVRLWLQNVPKIISENVTTSPLPLALQSMIEARRLMRRNQA